MYRYFLDKFQFGMSSILEYSYLLTNLYVILEWMQIIGRPCSVFSALRQFSVKYNLFYSRTAIYSQKTQGKYSVIL